MKLKGLLLAAAVAVGVQANGQIVLNQVDTFAGGTVMNWFGANPINVANGGPNGTGDAYCQIFGHGSFGGGGVPAMYNAIQWSGNYSTAGVAVIQTDIKNFGPSNLNMRLVLHGLDGSRWTSTTGIAVNSGSGWTRLTYILRADMMTLVAGTASFATTMTQVDRLMFRHDTGSPSAGGTPAEATVGFDNIRALDSVPVSPFSYSIEIGSLFGGTIASVANSDNLYLGFVNDELSPDTSVVFTGTSPITNPSRLKITLEAYVLTGGLAQFLELRNTQTSQWEIVSTQVATLTDSTVTGDITVNPSRFITPATGTMNARVRYIPTIEITAVDGWAEQIDLLRWNVFP